MFAWNTDFKECSLEGSSTWFSVLKTNRHSQNQKRKIKYMGNGGEKIHWLLTITYRAKLVFFTWNLFLRFAWDFHSNVDIVYQCEGRGKISGLIQKFGMSQILMIYPRICHHQQTSHESRSAPNTTFNIKMWMSLYFKGCWQNSNKPKPRLPFLLLVSDYQVLQKETFPLNISFGSLLPLGSMLELVLPSVLFSEC